jgi:hypothetical protein
MIATNRFSSCGNDQIVDGRLEARTLKIAADLALEAENRSTDCEVWAGLIDPD